MNRILPSDGVQYLRDLRDAREMGRIDEMVNLNHVPLKPDMSEREAAMIVGWGVIRRWVDEGLINVRQDGPGCKKRIDRVQFEEVRRASNRSTFMTVVERNQLKK